MKIKYEDDLIEKEEEISDFIESKLYCYDNGEFMGKLVNILREKNILTDKDIHELVSHIW